MAAAAQVPDTGQEDRLLAVVRELVAERHSLERAAGVTLSSAFDRDLGLDSLGVTELVTRLEDVFGVDLPREAIAGAATPRDLLHAVRAAPSRARRHTGVERHPVPPRTSQVPEATTTLIEALRWHARIHPDRVHLRILTGDEQELVSYGDLWRDATAAAAGLLAHDLRPGDAAAIMLPTGRAYFSTFAGVLLAGGVPAPIYPPTRPAQLEAHLRRQVGILDNAQARVLVSDPQAARLARLVRSQAETVRHVLTPEQLTGPGEAVAAARHPDDLALLQYTSGSTGDPKGVMLTHQHLLANIRAMGKTAAVSSQDVFVSWLPLYHDMGLIGAWLATMYFGVPLAVMSPLDFLTRPDRWLWALHTYRGTLSAAPNFAYELCLRKTTDAELEGLDLSSVRMLCNGAEPVQPDTLVRFAERFASYGLRREALAPVYGLAESCVGLAFPPIGRGPVVDRVKRDAFLRSGRAAPAAAGDPDALRFAACGRAIPGHQIRVVDPAGNPLADRREGRIEFRGPSATGGYFRDPTATRALVRRGWLDTGDLGYLDGGELYVTGRIKDLIIRAGRNLHPEELESAVGDLPGIRAGRVAVFATSGRDTTERLVVLAETRQTERDRLADLRGRITEVSVDLLGTPPDDIVLAPPGTVLKTSSGKIRRGATREHYERGRGEHRPPVWWQLARFAVHGLLPRLRRLGRIVSTWAFTAWCWSLLALVGVPTLIALSVLPSLEARRAVARTAARTLMHFTGTPISVDGADHLAATPHCVVVANHASFLDGIVMTAALPGQYTFVAGEVFERKPLIGFILRRTGTRFVERAEHQQSVADTQRLVEDIRAGERLVIFPEGSLSPMAALRPFHMGAFVLAAQARRPIVTVAISGTRAMLWPGHGTVIHSGAVHLVVGEPLHSTDTGWDAAVALEHTARAAIAAHCDEPDLRE
ncbi:AMP-binding protein [Glycomyces buryatensis]|uniref:Acyl-phosphate glycerol 3-phosphate acyltransferase n=1 Tax=Glycomyces buryatensis TaxID=2570927 RepID=A0A4S8QEW9_9ACTN|nr:AMP-binding protein [Glycomyces buryatensis]THV42221.1 acyl-phosphate glycerol 3-phosphate acyltransferase [Glycomyces buryatensis]